MAKRTVTVNQSNETAVAKRPNARLLEIGADDDFGFPKDIEDMPGEEGNVSVEWDPETPGEMLVGRLIRQNKMQLGGMAYVIGAFADYTKPDGPILTVLLKRGGRVLEGRMTDLSVKEGDKVALLYQGLGEAKEGQSAPRLWRVKKLR